MDCDCAYPVSDSYCIRCGKPLTDPLESEPVKVSSAIREALSDRVFDDYEMKRVIERTLRLINSNGSRLVKIRPGMFSDFDFVFVKEHRYFKQPMSALTNRTIMAEGFLRISKAITITKGFWMKLPFKNRSGK
nr:hypothetical protein [uncultured Methanobrevibacter sp.]